jgi:hypothetical protein
MEFIEVAEARELPGLRLVLTRGVPHPWGEFAKGVFRVKRLPFVAVSHYPMQPNEELREWTGQTSGPAAINDAEPVRASWGPILHLAERLERDPPLLPSAQEGRVRMLGLCEELAGEDGLGWNRRRLVLAESGSADRPPAAWPAVDRPRIIQIKYGGKLNSDERERAIGRIVAIVGAVGAQAELARSRGELYMFGGRLSAIDIMWAGFTQMLEPLPDEVCPIPPQMRALYTVAEPRIRAMLTPALLAHRDFMYMEHMTPPTDL